MKKNFLPIAVLLLLFACQKQETTVSAVDTATGTLKTAVAVDHCASMRVLKRKLASNPNLEASMQKVEAFTNNYISQSKNLRLINGKIVIPVYVNVLYNTSDQIISRAQINSQLAVLNQDFNALNSDINKIPALFSPLKANVGISFVLHGNGYTIKQTTKKGWDADDSMKMSSQGGIDPTSPTTVLNIWVCPINEGILGYAQFPGDNPATDGVVIHTNAFGTSGGPLFSIYNLGRTATHEVGHWMNLRHIWGDARCGDDFVSDTPLHHGPNFGVPVYPFIPKTGACSTEPEMTMNYMDYTDDRGMYMFTNGQKARINAVFAVGGSRASFR